MASTHLKSISQIGNLPQVGVKIKNIWNHHLVTHKKTIWKGSHNPILRGQQQSPCLLTNRIRPCRVPILRVRISIFWATCKGVCPPPKQPEIRYSNWKVDGTPSLHIGLFLDPLLISLLVSASHLFWPLGTVPLILGTLRWLVNFRICPTYRSITWALPTRSRRSEPPVWPYSLPGCRVGVVEKPSSKKQGQHNSKLQTRRINTNPRVHSFLKIRDLTLDALILFVTLSGVNSDLHFGDQKVTWKKLGNLVMLWNTSIIWCLVRLYH